MVVSRSRVAPAVLVFAVFLFFGLIRSAKAQGIQRTPYNAANEVRRLGPFSGPDSAPSNPLGLPGSVYGPPSGSDTIPLSSGLLGSFLPRIPNLEFGFLYNFGKDIRSGRFTADYVLPVNLSTDSVLFGEAHAEGWDFWKKASGGANNRVDMSLGGGYRKMLGDGLLLGANAFYDSSRLFSKWYSSGGLGLEMAATVGGDDAVDVNFNWYGNLFSRNGFINAFRNQGGSFDVEAGYSHAMLDHTVDLRLKVAGYQFDVGDKVNGWRGGADLTTRDGMFTVRYEHGQDRLNGAYDTVGGFVNIGFQLENVLKGESPFTMPEPVFRSPRNLRRMMALKVKRNWHQPTATVFARQSRGCNAERFLAAVPTPLYFSDPNSWTIFQTVGNDPATPAVPFPAVPYTCLDPTKNIMVEFDYEFGGGTPNFGFWNVEVAEASYTYDNVETYPILAGASQGHVMIPFGNGGWPTVDQSAFTTTATDPSLLNISALIIFTDGTTSLTITNVAIHFNQ